jgi:hypothetical protein
MAYGDFTLDSIEKKFGVKARTERIFGKIKHVKPSKYLLHDIKEAKTFPLRSEKAKSEWVVTPLLKELRRSNGSYFTVYSGEFLNVDMANGLNGECDFIISKDIGTYTISYPILQVVEAKKGDIDLGVAQCSAQMIGAKIYNDEKGTPVDMVYGCVTNGSDYLFLKLSDKIIIDTQTYSLTKLSELLGVFQSIIDYYKETLK